MSRELQFIISLVSGYNWTPETYDATFVCSMFGPNAIVFPLWPVLLPHISEMEAKMSCFSQIDSLDF